MTRDKGLSHSPDLLPFESFDKYRSVFFAAIPSEEIFLSEKSVQRTDRTMKHKLRGNQMENLSYITLRERPELKDAAAEWFHGKWGIPTEAYLECMNAYLSGDTEEGWYLSPAAKRKPCNLNGYMAFLVPETAGFPLCFPFTE